MVLRELFVKLGLDVDLQTFVKGHLIVEAVKTAVGYLAEQAIEAAGQVEEMVHAIVDSTVEIRESSEALDINAQALQRFRTATAEAGIGSDVLQAGLRNLRDKGDPDDLARAFLDLSDEIAALEDPTEQATLATQKLGQAGKDLLPLLRRGSEEIQRLGLAADAFTDDQIEAGRALAGAQKTLADMSTRLWRTAIGPLLPLINRLVQKYIEWRKANDEVTRSRITWAVGLLIRAVEALWRAFDAVMKVIDRFSESLNFIWQMIYLRLVKAFDLLKQKAKSAFEYLRDNFQKLRDFLAEHGLQLVLAGLAVAFTYLGYAGTVSALKTAAAWALTLVKFTALAALISAIYLAFDDIATYEESVRRGGTGKNTLYGKWKTQIDEMVAKFRAFITEWLKPNAEDPWWLKAIKALVRYLDKAYGIADKLHITAPEDRKYVDPNTLQAKALRAVGVSDPSWVGTMPGMTYRPEGGGVKNLVMGSDSILADTVRDLFRGRVEWNPWAKGSGAASVTDNSKTTVTVHAAPGQSAQEIADEVLRRQREERETWWDEKMEAAAAATGY